jgi:hypothetical protein
MTEFPLAGSYAHLVTSRAVTVFLKYSVPQSVRDSYY